MTNEELETFYSKCIIYSNIIKNSELRECCQTILKDYKQKMFEKPATGGPCHHFFRGGLLFHTYCVTRNAIMIANLYPDISFDLDLIIFGSLLHDIGKVNDYKNFNDININDEHENGILSSGAYMVGHSYEGSHIVENYLNKYQIDDKFKYQALHMIGCHMKEFGEFGVLTSPKMIEVIIINYADSMDARLNKTKNGLNHASKGELYFTEDKSNKYYKSINPNYEN